MASESVKCGFKCRGASCELGALFPLLSLGLRTAGGEEGAPGLGGQGMNEMRWAWVRRTAGA